MVAYQGHLHPFQHLLRPLPHRHRCLLRFHHPHSFSYHLTRSLHTPILQFDHLENQNSPHQVLCLNPNLSRNFCD
jgi:hypothetical protein